MLLDPYFVKRGLPMHEPVGLRPDELPPLAAILGGHGVFDHWQPRSLRLVGDIERTRVLVPNEKMARGARRAGVSQVDVVGPGDERRLSERLTVTAFPGERVMRFDTLAFLLATPDTRIYVSTEARDLASIEPAVGNDIDYTVLPIDGLTLRPLRRRLVMDAATALEATRRLGAHTLLPIHYSQRSIPGLLKPTSGIDDLISRTSRDRRVRIVHGATGERVVASTRFGTV